MRYPRLFLAMTLTTGAAAAVLAGGAPAATETFTEKIEMAQIHPCTLEPVEGDGRVHLVMTTTTNPDGSTRVRVLQQTHGQTLIGAISGDQYVFNNGDDVLAEETFFGSSGRIITRLEFIHQGEDVAYLETPGFDDFHERLVITFTPLNPPTIQRDRQKCQ